MGLTRAHRDVEELNDEKHVMFLLLGKSLANSKRSPGWRMALDVVNFTSRLWERVALPEDAAEKVRHFGAGCP